MYNQPQQYITRSNLIRTAAVLLFLGVIIYIITHGFLTIVGFKPDTTFRHSSFTGELRVSSSSQTDQSVKILPSGGYSVMVPTESGGIDAFYAPVPTFMRTENVVIKDQATDIKVIARGTTARVALDSQGALIGWDESGVTKPLNNAIVDNSTVVGSSNAFFPNFERPIQLDATTIGGVTKLDNEYVPTFFSYKTGDNSVFDSISSETSLYSREEMNGFSIFDESKKEVNLYQPGTSKVVKTKLSETPSKIDGIPLASAGKTKVAFVTGGDLHSTNEDESVKIKKPDLTLRVVEAISGKQLDTKKIGETQLRDVRFSNDEKLLYVQTDQAFFILDAANLDIRYAAHMTINQFKWSTGDSFVFTTLDQGIFAGSVGNKAASTLAPYSLVQPTDISFIKDGVVTFTAYSQSNEGVQNPDTYTASLRPKRGSGSLGVLREFPHQAEEYYADYIDGKVIVELTKYISSTGESVNEEARAAAEAFVSEKFGDNRPEIIYSYVISDLRAPTSTE